MFISFGTLLVSSIPTIVILGDQAIYNNKSTTFNKIILYSLSVIGVLGMIITNILLLTKYFYLIDGNMNQIACLVIAVGITIMAIQMLIINGFYLFSKIKNEKKD